jgi:hypothetical protein
VDRPLDASSMIGGYFPRLQLSFIIFLFLYFIILEYIWLLSRDGVLSNPTRQNLYEKLDYLKINRSGLQLTDRSGCPSNITREESEELAPILTTSLPSSSSSSSN